MAGTAGFECEHAQGSTAGFFGVDVGVNAARENEFEEALLYLSYYIA